MPTITMVATGVATGVATAVATEVAVATDRWDGLLLGATLATLDADSGYGLVEDGALGWKDGVLVHAGTRASLPGNATELADEVIETEGLVTPAATQAAPAPPK